jgi:natural product biosynthesis luciferase-like monooxygenase protein/amino acid adenylation domain-containing protein/FkbM family methyltransferase
MKPMTEELFVIPTSFAQQRFWFLDQLEPGNPTYNISAAFSLEGRLDTKALERSLNEVVRRHESLRTAFALVDGRPMQLIAPSRKLEMRVIDLQHMETRERDARVRESAAEEARRGFDLREGPLLRASVLRLGAERHVLLLTLHHIVADAWSVGVLVRELGALYAAYGKGEESPLPELPVQYADYAVWQRQRLTAATLEAQLAYWKRQLAGAPAVLELPADRPRAAGGGLRGAKQSFELSAELSAALRRLSRGEGVTLFMTLLAAFNLLLQRYTGQDDILVGTPVAGRTRPETKELIGLFVNTLVLRTDLSGDPTFRELLSRVRATAVEAYAHQDVPFERLVEELNVERSLSRSPLFQVMFALNNTPQDEFQLPGLKSTRLDTESDTAKFDLTLTLLEQGELLTGTLKYNSDLFEPDTIGRMLAHWERLLAGVVTSPDTPVSVLPLLTPDEERQLLVEWNGTQAELPVSPASVTELFEAQARRRPDAAAVIYEETLLTYAELNRRANRLARRLRGMGVGAEAVVGVCVERSAEMVVALLGVLKAGAAYLPLDPQYPPQRIALLLEDARARVLLTQRRLLDEMAACAAREAVCVDEDRPDDDAWGGEDLEVKVAGESLAYVIYTSGSTGLPKGVQIEHRQLLNYVQGIVERLRLPAGAGFATVSTLAADLGNTAIYPALCTGGLLHVISRERVADAEALADSCSRHPYDCLKIVPSHLQALLDSPRAKQVLPLRRLILGGEACSWALIDKVRELAPDCVIFNHYGPTEATIGALTYEVAEDLSGRPARNPPLGRPLPNVRVYLLDERLRPVPVGVRGELYIGGDGIARGYAGRPELTADRFIPDPFGVEPGRRLYRTGDAARYLPRGEVEFLGRIDNQLKLRGYRVEPGEIEAALRGHRSIREAAVVAHEGRSGDKSLAAYVVPEAEAPALQSGDLRDFLKSRLPAHMIPSTYVLLESLPLTANGKIDRKALKPPERAVNPPTGSQTVADPIEGLLQNIWAELLHLEDVGSDENFFDLGGHSLLATQVISRVREAFGVEIPLRTLFERPTVAEFARALEAALRREPEPHPLPLVPITGTAEKPMSYAQQRLWFLDQMQPGSAFYNLPGAIRLTGELDLTALERGLQEVVRRHEVLRLGFDSVEGRPVPASGPQAHLHLPVTSLENFPEDEREEEARRILLEEAERPFDLAKGPMLRVQLLRLVPQSHLLLVTMHHIAADGWSIGIFIRELATCYEAFTRGTTPALPELKVQYADYAHWQRERLQGGFLDRDLLYWKEQLADAPALLALPLDRPRPPVQTFRGALRSFTLPPDLSRELRAFSRREGVTLFMTLLAVFKVLLARHSGQQDIVVGTPISGRNHVATEALIGFFVNMLVLRTNLDDDPTARELLHRVRETALGAYAHQEAPFERLVEELNVERSLSRSPLFQVMFALNNTPVETLKLSRLDVSLVSMSSETAKYDLTFALDERPEGLRLKVEYNTDLFDHETIARMAGHYQRLLACVVGSPDTPVSALPLLAPEEERQLLVEWNSTETVVAPATVTQLFEERVERAPDVAAVVYEGAQLTYAELNRRANRLAHHLRSLGVGADSVVGVCVERSAEMVVALLAVLKAGGAYLPLDPQYPAERIALLLGDAGASLVLTQPGTEEAAVKAGARTLRVGEESEWAETGGDENLGVNVDVENLAYVIYTSGSTGRPKGVAISHRNVVNFFAGMDERVGSDGPQTWLALTSISFDISVLELFWTLTRGHKVVIQGRQHALSPSGSEFGGAQDKEMQFSLFYFASDDSLGGEDSYRLLIEGAKFADRNGFTAVWTPERHFHAFGGLYANPSVTGAAVATVTERIQIRAGSVVIPLHEPIRVAEEWAMVDNLSHGRVAVSFASGWHANDFVLAPDIYRERHEVMYRNIETVRRLWRGESIVRRDGAGKEIEVKIHPRPVQPELPVWITAAGSPETFKTAGRMGANMLTHLLGQTVEELADKIALYRAAWREHGHGQETGHVTLMLHTFISDDVEEVRRKVRAPFSNYLRSSVNLLRSSARSLGRDIDSSSLNEEDMQAILAHAFDRYFETSALLGTPESGLRMIERLKEVGIDEVACLIDFGVADEEVLSNLPQLSLLRELSNARPHAQSDDYSIAAQISRQRVTHLQCTPSLARMLLAEPEAADSLQSLKGMLVGGEALPATLAQQLRRKLSGALHNMYGPTETTIWSTTHQIERAEGKVTIGRPIANTTTRILDAKGRPVPVGVVGELYVGGSGVARGYLHLPALTAERFVPDPFAAEPGARMYRTGDMARYLPGGDIEFHGRVDHQVKINGHRIEPGEIETLLRQYPGVKEAVVSARKDEAGESRLLAYVVPVEDGDARRLQMVSAPEAARLLGDRAHFKLPNGMVVAHPSGHRATVLYHEIFENESYLRHGITLRDGDCVFDVGANVGMFTLFASHKRKDLKLYAFEPIPQTFDTLKTNVALYGLDAKLFNVGLGSRPGAADFTFYPRMPGLSGRFSSEARDKEITKAIIEGYLREHGSERERAILSDEELNQLMEEYFQSETYTCPLTTLSEVIREHGVERIDLLKVDVEKSEFDVLAGLDAEDWAKVGQIVMEIDTRELLAQISELLARHQFDFTTEEIVSVEKGVAGAEVHVYMLYAVRPEQHAAGDGRAARPGGETEPREDVGGGALSAARLRRYLRDKLPPHMIPSAFTLLPALPLMPNGKLDLKALPEPTEFAPELSAAYVAPETGGEQIIAQVWRDVLKVAKVGVNDNFFEAGGTSLRLVEVNSRLREAFKRSIPVVEMFRHPTISDLARYLEAGEAERPNFAHLQERASKGADVLNQQRQAAARRRKGARDAKRDL